MFEWIEFGCIVLVLAVMAAIAWSMAKRRPWKREHKRGPNGEP